MEELGAVAYYMDARFVSESAGTLRRIREYHLPKANYVKYMLNSTRRRGCLKI